MKAGYSVGPVYLKDDLKPFLKPLACILGYFMCKNLNCPDAVGDSKR